MDEDCLSRICSSSLTPASPKEVMQYSSDDFKKLQSHCYSCGSETGAFKKYKATRKSGAPEMRFRCGKCRRFTGNIYVKLRDDTYMLSRLDPQKYTRQISEEVGGDQQHSTALPDGSDSTKQYKNTSDESLIMNEDKKPDVSSPLPRLKIKIAGGKIVESTLKLDDSEPNQSTDSLMDSPNTTGDSMETSFELLESVGNDEVDETKMCYDDVKTTAEQNCTVDLAIPSTSTTNDPHPQNVNPKPLESVLNSDGSTESGKGANSGDIRRKRASTSCSVVSNRKSKCDDSMVTHGDEEISLNGSSVNQGMSSKAAETETSPSKKGNSLSPLSTEKQSRKEDAKNSDDQSQLNESTEQMVKGEEVRVVPPAGGHRRRRPQTMRKHTNARQRNRRISSSDDESSKDDKNEESVESTQSISVSHSKKSAPVKTNTKECNANAVRDRKTPSETKNEHKEVFSEVVPSTSSNHRTASTRADVKQQKRSKTNGADRESFKIPSISKAKSTVPSSHKKTVPKSAGNMTDEKHVQKKLTSCGVQAFLEDIEQHPSTSLVPVSSQTSDSELIEYLMDKWNNEESATLCKEIDSNQMKRRLKMARFVIESQRNEIKKLSDKYCKLEELFCCAKSAFDELKKTLMFELSRVRGDVGSLSSEFRLYHLDLKRGCDMCASKVDEDTRRFHLVASKYEADKCRLKEQLIAKDEEMAQLRGVIDSKTRQLLVADRDLHLANERVISIQKKLEDKLFVATNTKCTTCNVFDKYRDVLTTQIADKTAALADANVILNDVRMKLDKQERASKILSRENDKMKFERDIWMADSKRLENEVRLLRAQLSTSSAIENNSTNSVNNNTSTPSDGSGSVHRLFGDSKAISGGISDAHNSPATSSSTPQNLQSPIFGQDKSVCPPPPELPSLVGKFRHSNSSSDSSKAKVSCMPSSSSKRDNNSQPSSRKDWKSNSTTRAHYTASKTNGQTIQRPSRTTTRLSEDTNNKTAKSDNGQEKLERENAWKKETKTVGERSSKAIDSVSESTTTKSHSASPNSSNKTDLSKSSKQTSQSEEKSPQKRMDDENKTTQPNSNSKKALIVPPPKDESEISSASTSDSKCETRSAKSENKSGRASTDSEQKPRPDSNKKSHPPKSLFSSLAGHSRWPDVIQPHSSGSSKKRKRHELMEQDEEMMLWRVSEQRRKDDEHWRRLRAADGVRLEGDEEGDAEEFRFRPNDHFNNSRAPPPMMDSMGAAEPLFANDPFCNRKSSPIFMVDETRSPVNEFPTWRSTRRGGLLDGERSPHFIDFDHDRPRTECDERWTMARSEPLNGRFERRELPIGRVDGYRPMLVPPTDHFGRASFSDREVWHQGMLMDSPFNDSASERERIFRERLHRERLSEYPPIEDSTSLLSRRGDTFLNRRIPIEDIPWGMDIRHDERWRDTPSDWTFEDFGFAGRGFRPM